MSEFDIHVGRINTLYRELWGHVNGELSPKEAVFRRALALATQAVCDKYDLYESVADFVSRYPEVTYKPESSRPIQIGEGMIPVDTWLLRFGRFSSNDRVYEWTPDHLLSFGDDQYDTFFAYLWAKMDVMRSDEFLNYYLQQTYDTDKNRFVHHLRKIALKYGAIVPNASFDTLTTQYESMPTSERTSPLIFNPKDIVIKSPKIQRQHNDKATALNSRQTAKFVEYLRQAEVFFKDDSYQPSINVYKAIQALTGYHYDSVRKEGESDLISKDDLKIILTITDNISKLINNDIRGNEYPKKKLGRPKL